MAKIKVKTFKKLRTRKRYLVYSKRRKQVGDKVMVRSIAWHGSPFPPVLKTQFTYAQNFTIQSTVGAVYNYLFSANSLYDPDVSGTGTQPRFMDTLIGANGTAAPYQYYRVFGSKLTFEAIHMNDSLGDRGMMGLGLFTSSQTGPSSLAELRARSDFKTRYIGLYTGGRELCRLTRTGGIKNLFGVKDLKDDEQTAAAYNASPAKAARWCISYVPFDETSTGNLRVLVKITYYCELFSRNDVSDS